MLGRTHVHTPFVPLLYWQRHLLIAGSIFLTVAFFYWARPVVVPVVLAILVTFILAPVVSGLQRLGMGRIPSAILVIVCADALLLGLVLFVLQQIQGLGAQLHLYRREGIVEKIAFVQESVHGSWLENGSQFLEEISKQLKQDATGPEPVPAYGSNLWESSRSCKTWLGPLPRYWQLPPLFWSWRHSCSFNAKCCEIAS